MKILLRTYGFPSLNGAGYVTFKIKLYTHENIF